MDCLSLSYLLLLVYIAKCVQGVTIDLSRYDPSKNSHLEAVITFQNLMEGRPPQPFTPWSIEKLRSVQPSRLSQLYNPANPLHVATLQQFQSALREGPPLSLFESAQEGVGRFTQSVQSTLSPSTYLSAAGSLMPSAGGITSMVTSGIRWLLSFLWKVVTGALAIVFPPLAILQTFTLFGV